MSDTPRTDEWIRLFNGDVATAPSVAEFASQLERELADAIALLREISGALPPWLKEYHRIAEFLETHDLSP